MLLELLKFLFDVLKFIWEIKNNKSNNRAVNVVVILEININL